MISLNSLQKTTTHGKKRLGQGLGSGKGKTGGKGTKGQKSRGKTPPNLGDKGAAFLRRMPLYRGKFRNKPVSAKPEIVNLSSLNILPKGTVVTVDTLITHKLVVKAQVEKYGVKILGDGDLTVPLTVHVPCSGQAKEKIEKAGGTIQMPGVENKTLKGAV